MAKVDIDILRTAIGVDPDAIQNWALEYDGDKTRIYQGRQVECGCKTMRVYKPQWEMVDTTSFGSPQKEYTRTQSYYYSDEIHIDTCKEHEPLLVPEDHIKILEDWI